MLTVNPAAPAEPPAAGDADFHLVSTPSAEEVRPTALTNAEGLAHGFNLTGDPWPERGIRNATTHAERVLAVTHYDPQGRRVVEELPVSAQWRLEPGRTRPIAIYLDVAPAGDFRVGLPTGVSVERTPEQRAADLAADPGFVKAIGGGVRPALNLVVRDTAPTPRRAVTSSGSWPSWPAAPAGTGRATPTPARWSSTRSAC